MSTSRDVAIAIGVSDAKPLPYLAGAINAAHAFHKWASNFGYASTVVTDEVHPVTIARLRSELEALLAPAEGPIHRLLIYFSGHGLIREAEEGLWLLSDWHDELKAVAVEVLKRRLYMHEIQQISIFSDSCRLLPTNITAADLAPDPVLGRGPLPKLKQPALDKFLAAQDGDAAFVIPGANPKDDRCLFSGLLLEGLWGSRPEAFSRLEKDKITSRSLAAYLVAEVPKLAEYYKCKLYPTVSATFPEGDDIYFGSFGKSHPPLPPKLPPWPPASSVMSLGPESRRAQFSNDMAAVGQASHTTNGPSQAGITLIEKIRSQPRPQRFETSAGFAIEGTPVRRIWKPADVFAEVHGKANYWRLGSRSGFTLVNSAPVLIEFEDGMFAATTALPGYIATLLRDERQISALIYRSVDASPDTAAITEMAIAKMEHNALRAEEAMNLAVSLHQMKHLDPVLGVISAYLYDAVGDVDNIRRMAFFYLSHNQPIPYDIALLAQLRGEWRNGHLWAHVPPVSERKPRPEIENSANWTHSATPPMAGPVAGLWPWMRQGWTFLDYPEDNESTLIAPGLSELMGHLAPGRFAILDTEGGHRLAVLFGLSDID